MNPGKNGGPVLITAIGLVSSLGHDAITACAAARAGLTRATQLRVLNFYWDKEWGGEPLAGHVVSGIGDGFVGTAKTILLSSAALQDLKRNHPLSFEEYKRTALHVNVTDSFVEDAVASEPEEKMEETAPGEEEMEAIRLPSDRWREDCGDLLSRIAGSAGMAIPEANCRLYFDGHAGIVQALQDGCEALTHRKIDFCIVGGVDSLISPRVLIASLEKGLVKTGEKSVGFMPGEGAAFFLLERAEPKSRVDGAIRISIAASSIKRDPNNRFAEEPPVGRVLFDVIDSVLSHTSRNSGNLFVIGDLNGDVHRAMDWGHAVVRFQERYGLGDLPHWLPALAFGETGAASGPLAVCMAVRSFVRDYAPGSEALVWVSSENGLKGALLLRAVKGTTGGRVFV